MLILLPYMSLAIDKDIERNIYNASIYNIPNERLSRMELDAFDGDAQSAYKLGRYFQYCLGSKYDIKIACVYYYMARCFGHLGAYLQLNDILLNNNTGGKYPASYDIFGNFTSSELDDLKNTNSLLSRFILYNNYRLNEQVEKSQKYSSLLYGKISPRFFKTFKEIEDDYPIAVPLSRPHIEFDELPIFETLALLGDKSKAMKLMAYYRFSNPAEKRNNYLRNLWAYISYVLGHKKSKDILEYHYKGTIAELFVEIKQSNIVCEGDCKGDMLYDLIMLNYSRAKQDKRNEEHYYNQLKSKGTDKRLLNPLQI